MAAVAMVFGVLIHTYSFSLRASINSPSLMVGDDPAAMETSKFLKEVISDNNRLITKDTLYLCYSQYYSPFNFYEKALTHEAINLIRINNIESISFPANVIIPQNEQQLAISQNYNYRIAHELDKVKFFEIISKK